MSSSLLVPEAVVDERFRLVREIGRGGMGSVWETHDQNLGNVCAIKFIEGQLANAAEAQERFKREATAAAALRSQHVVQILDHGVWQGIPYIAMELLKGQDLGKRLGDRGRLSPQEVITIIHQVCRALTKAHAAGVVHRDLKPDNIFLVNEDADSELVKILDFGVAKQTGQAIEGTNTKTGAMLGTPYYMSPEQAQGIKSVDFRSDLWSLAVIVFQCLTGRLPFESEALGDLLVKIIRDDPPLPTAYNPQLPKAFDLWWGKASQRNPEARWQTAKEFATELENALGAKPSLDLTQERSRIQRFAGGTAVMGDAGANVAEMRRQLAAGGGAFAAPNPMMQTPNPNLPSNPLIQAAPPYMQTPQGFLPPQQPQPSMMQTPANPPMAPPMNPAAGATFSGVEPPPAGVPKKGGGALLVLVGLLGVGVLVLGIGAFAFYRSRHVTADLPIGSASAPPAASSVVPPPASVTATPPASASATNDAPAPTPSASASAAPPQIPGGHTTARPTATAKTPPKPSATPAPTPGGVTPHGVGF